MPSFLCLQHERLSAMPEPAVMADKRPCINECQGYPGYPDGRTDHHISVSFRGGGSVIK